MINAAQFRELVVRQTLLELAPEIPYSIAAENLLMGTAAQESKLSYLQQIRGPALGVFQMEPTTFRWLWDDWLAKRPILKLKFVDMIPSWRVGMPEREMIGNLYFAAAMCRLRYWVVTEKLPDGDDVRALARYWKAHYNTPAGAGHEDDFVEAYALTFDRRAARASRDYI